MRWSVLLTVVVTFSPGVADAQSAPPPCGTTDRPWIRVEAADDAVVSALRTELAADGFDACRDGGPAAPLARATIAVNEARYTITVADVVTAKRIERDVDLRTLPRDGRALAVALATDELLRASWAELVVADAPPPAVAVPPPVQRSVDRSVRAAVALPAPKSGAIAVAFAGETFTGGQTLGGVDARAEWFASSAFAATLRVGFRAAPTQHAADGDMRASTFLGGVGLAYRVLGASRFGLRAFVRVDAADVTYVAEPHVGATATSGSAWTLLASGGAELGWSPLPALRLTAEIGAMTPTRPVHATEDGSDVVSSVSGAALVRGLGAGALF